MDQIVVTIFLCDIVILVYKDRSRVVDERIASVYY